MDIVTIGEVLIDLTQTGKDERGIPQFAANPGGAPANLAVAAARLGAQTTPPPWLWSRWMPPVSGISASTAAPTLT